MAVIKISTAPKFQRPIVNLYGLDCLIDTGAVIPLFSMPKVILENMFKARKTTEKHVIGGIGGESQGDVYCMDEFKIGEITYSPFEVFVPYTPTIKYPVLLGAPLFHGMFYGFDTVENNFVIDTKEAPLKRQFRLVELRGQLYCQIDDVLVQDSRLLLSDMLCGL